MRIIQSLFFLYILSVVTISAQSVEPPMLYNFPYLCPSCSEEMEMSIRVSSEGTSVGETHAISATPIIDPEYDDSEWVPGNLISGPLTNGLTGGIKDWEQEIGTVFIEVEDKVLPEIDTRYIDEDLTEAGTESKESSWSVNDFTVSVENTGQQETIQGFSANVYEANIQFTKTDYSPEGQQTLQSDVNYQFQLWLSEQVPFTPIPFHYEPFKENHIPPYNLSPINDLVASAIIDRVQDKGGLLKSKLLFDNEEWTVEMKSVKSTPPVPMHKFENLPVISSSQVDNFAGPLFIVSMLRDRELRDMGSGTIRIDDQELAANSSW